MHRRNNFRFSCGCGCGFDCGGIRSRGCGCGVVSNDQIICVFVGKTPKLKLQLNKRKTGIYKIEYPLYAENTLEHEMYKM